MKNIVLLLIAICSALYSFSQSKEEYSENAKIKKANNDFVGAIADYSKAIKLDPQNGDYYCGRGHAKVDLPFKLTSSRRFILTSVRRNKLTTFFQP